jgi:hypothetical protein
VGPALRVPSPQSITDPLILPPWFGSVEAEVEAVIVAGAVAVVAERVRAATGATAFAVTAAVAVLVTPLVVTVEVTVYEPGTEYVWFALVPLTVVPSPKSIMLLEMVAAAPDSVPLVVVVVEAETARGAFPVVGVTEREEFTLGGAIVKDAAFDILLVIDGLPIALTYSA